MKSKSNTRTFLLAFLIVVPTLASAQTYIRFAAVGEAPRETTFRDRNCASTQPPALFGCATGSDGNPIGAHGEFDNQWKVEIGVGREFSSRVRAELVIAPPNDLYLDAQANFVGAGSQQPVSARADATVALIRAIVELGPDHWTARPHIELGGGVSQNRIGPVTYGFPALGADAVTTTPGGRHTDTAWSAGLGFSLPVTRVLALDLTLRHSDYGQIRTKAGTATIVRPSRTVTLQIDETRASLRATGVALGARVRF